MTRTRSLTAVALVALGLVAGWALWPSSPARLAGPGLAQTDSPRRLVWPAGLVRRYQLAVIGQTSLPAPGGEQVLSGALQTRATLELRGYGERAGHTMVGLRLTALGEATMTFMGSPAMQDRAGLEAALVGPEGFIEFLPTGDVHAVSFPPDTHNLFKGLVQTVVGEVQAPLRDGATWTLLETTPRGKAEAAFTLEGQTLTRQRRRYAVLSGFGQGLSDLQLEAKGVLALSPEGQLVSAKTSEFLRGKTVEGSPASSRLELTLEPLGTDTVAVAALPEKLETQPLNKAPMPADAKEQVLTQRIAGLTEQELFSNVEAYGAAGTLPNLGLFMARSTGLLHQNPMLCEKLAERATLTTTSVHERNFALELLAATGSNEAQAAMRAVLSSAVVAKDPLRRERFLRVTLVKSPTPETVAFVGEQFLKSQGAEHQTLGLVLGAAAGALTHSKQPELAEPWLDALAAELSKAPDTATRVNLLRAFGNAGVEARLGEVLRYRNDPDAEVRGAVVNALRKTVNAETRAVIVLSVSDPSPKVAVPAITLLGNADPTPGDRQAIISTMRSGRLPWSDAHAVITALAPFAKDDPVVRGHFEWLLTQRALDPSHQRRLRSLLGKDQGL